MIRIGMPTATPIGLVDPVIRMKTFHKISKHLPFEYKRFLLNVLLLSSLLNSDVYAQSAKQVERLFQSALNLREEGNRSEALPLLQRALAIQETSFGHNKSSTADILNAIGLIYNEMGDHEKALPFLERSVDINENIMGPDHAATATSLGNLGLAHHDLGDYAKALVLYERALAIREQAKDPQQLETANSLNSLGLLYSDMGDPAKALPLLERALAITEKILGPNHPATANGLGSVGYVYGEIGNYSKARAMHERALAIHRKTLGKDHPDTATSMANLGFTYMNSGESAKAVAFYEGALSIREKMLGPDHPATAMVLDNMGFACVDLAEFAKARRLHERALAIKEKALGPEHPSVAVCLDNIGYTHHQTQEYAEALAFFERALAIREEVLGPQHPQTAASYSKISHLNYLAGNVSSARLYASKDISAKQRVLQSILLLDEDTRLSWQRDNSPHDYACVLRPEPLAQLMLRFKGIVLDSLLEDRALATMSETTTESRRKVEDISALRSKLAQIVFSKERQDEVAGLEEQIVQLQRSLATRATWAGRVRVNADITIDEIVPTLLQGSTLIDLIRFNDSKLKGDQAFCYGAIITGTGGEPAFVRIDAAPAVDRAIDSLRAAINAGDPAVVVEQINLLSAKVWQPIAAQIPKDTRRLFISPDADLNFLSFASLLENDGSFVAEKYHIVYIGSGRDLVRQSSSNAVKSVVIFANPDFGAEAGESSAKDLVAMRSGEAGLFGSIALPDLPGTAAEAESLEAIARQASWQPSVFAGALATESAVREVKAPSVLHLATHGFYLNSSIDPAFAARGMKTQSSGHEENALGGIGAALALDDADKLLVKAVLPNGAAKSAGLRVHDVILSVDGKPADSLSIEEAIGLIRGKVGTSVHLVVSRDGSEESLEFDIVRGSLPSTAREEITQLQPMMASGVALTGAQRTLEMWSQRKAPDPETDGILTAEEVTSLNLDGTWLVTLSACETGVGEARSGEGVFGLRRAFMIAGAENLLMTLWPVADDTTASIMADFYKEALVTGDAPGSLAKVQRDWLVKLREEKGLAAAIREAGPFAMVMMTAPTHPPIELPPIAKLEPKAQSAVAPSTQPAGEFASEPATQPTGGSAEKNSNWWPF